MSSAPSFKDEPPSYRINRSNGATPAKPQAAEDSDANICTVCRDQGKSEKDYTFKSAGGLGSHITHKHGEKAEEKQELDMSDEIAAIKAGDIIFVSIPQTTQRLYDRETNTYIRSIRNNIPAGFQFYKIVKNDIVLPATNIISQPRSFMEIMAIRDTAIGDKHE